MHVLILFAATISRLSGTSERVFQIAKGLADYHVQVTLSGASGVDVESLDLTNLQVITMPNRIAKLPSIFRWVAELVASGLIHRYHVVQIESFSLARSLALFLLLRPFSRKRIIVFHDAWFENDPKRSVAGKLDLFLQKILLRLFDASITTGLSVKKWFEELHGELASGKIVVIPNGAPNLDIKEGADYSLLREKYGVDPNAFVALFFGSMTFKPNYEDAMQLYRLSNSLSNEFKRITMRKLIFLVAGLNSKLLPKTACFVPLGFVEKLDDLLSLPDVMIFPHLPSYSGAHVKTIYAFLSRKPVIATEDAIRDMPNVADKEHFLQFDIQKPNTLTDALTNLYYDRELGKNLALNAFRYSKKFSWKYASSLHLNLYRKILQEQIST